ncbi:GNAT family N-acetyltransferase [Microbulbifer sp. EKSA008]|uniref:GNAT family N-acetyltransferase n=1 Tax=Microbulbifer sp. EKSA008 TaxID=3243367 RepID=UPI0040433112
MIRKAKLKELDRLEQLWLHASANSHPSIPRQFWVDRIAQFRKDCRSATQCLVYTDRNNAVAEAFITLLSDGTVTHLCVSPLFTGCGIGTNLISAIRDRRYPLKAEVLRENLRTRYFLQKHGFVEVERSYHVEYGQHSISMQCPRASAR